MSKFKILETSNPNRIILELPSGKELHLCEKVIDKKKGESLLEISTQMTDHDRMVVVPNKGRLINSVTLKLDYHFDDDVKKATEEANYKLLEEAAYYDQMCEES